MVWSLMGKTNDGMWNSSTHAMSDISSLAYRRSVPACDIIVPAEVAEIDRISFGLPRDRKFQSNLADGSWNKVDNGRGRGALLKNRNGLHRNDKELINQLRLASELEYSNRVIEATFQNRRAPRPLEDEETDASSHGGTITEEKGRTTPKMEEIAGEEDPSIRKNGEWNWEARREKPAPNRVLLKNVALLSLQRKKLKAAKQAGETVPLQGVSPCKDKLTSSNITPKVKEDWRAENKAMEEAARRSQVPEDVSTKGKKGWGSKPCDPKINTEWSLFTQSVTASLKAKDDHSVPTTDSGHQTVVDSSTTILESGLDLPRRKKKNKKKKNVRVMYVSPSEPPIAQHSSSKLFDANKQGVAQGGSQL